MNQMNETVFVNQEIEAPNAAAENSDENLMQLYRELGQAYYEGAYEDPLPQLLPLFDQITEFRKVREMQQEKELFRESRLMDGNVPLPGERPEEPDAKIGLGEAPTECELQESAPQMGASEETELVQDSPFEKETGAVAVSNDTDLAFAPAVDSAEKAQDDIQAETENTVKEESAEHTGEVQTAPAAESPAVQSVCRFCGAVLPEGAVFCGNCGKQAEQPPMPEPEPVPAERPRFCQNCGSPIGEETMFCGNCGTPVETGGEY